MQYSGTAEVVQITLLKSYLRNAIASFLHFLVFKDSFLILCTKSFQKQGNMINYGKY